MNQDKTIDQIFEEENGIGKPILKTIRNRDHEQLQKLLKSNECDIFNDITFLFSLFCWFPDPVEKNPLTIPQWLHKHFKSHINDTVYIRIVNRTEQELDKGLVAWLNKLIPPNSNDNMYNFLKYLKKNNLCYVELDQVDMAMMNYFNDKKKD